MTARRQPSLVVILATVLVIGLIIVVARRELRDLTTAHASLVAWVPIEDAAEQSRSTNKPILYEFTAAWCPPCRSLERDVFDDATLAARINETFVPVRVLNRQREDGANKPEVERLETRYQIQAFPTVIVADADGKVRTRLEGYGGSRAFMRQVEDAAR